MKKEDFLRELTKELKNNNVSQIDEIIEDYEQHFAFKIEEGKTEEEIVRKFEDPKEIAKEYASSSKKTQKGQKGIALMGISFTSIFAFCVYIVLFSTVVILGALSLVSLTIGACFVTSSNIANLLPSMPYLYAFIFGISFFGLALLSAIGTIYLVLYVNQWAKAYFRWCKNLINNNIYPSLSTHPKISKKQSSKYKMLLMIGLIVFISAFTINFVLLSLYTGTLGFWHALNWFV